MKTKIQFKNIRSKSERDLVEKAYSEHSCDDLTIELAAGCTSLFEVIAKLTTLEKALEDGRRITEEFYVEEALEEADEEAYYAAEEEAFEATIASLQDENLTDDEEVRKVLGKFFEGLRCDEVMLDYPRSNGTWTILHAEGRNVSGLLKALGR